MLIGARKPIEGKAEVQTVENSLFDDPILNSAYEYPLRHWELDEAGQEWLDNCLDRWGGTYPSQLMYQSLADGLQPHHCRHYQPAGRSVDQTPCWTPTTPPVPTGT